VKRFFKFLFNVVKWSVIKIIVMSLMFILVIIISVNLLWANVFDEYCGNLHPMLFTIDAVTLDATTGYWLSAPNNIIPADTIPDYPEMSPTDPDYADYWRSCIEYYGYMGENGFVMYTDGIALTGINPSTDSSSIMATVELSESGQFMLYIFVPSLVILLPIITVYIIRREWGIIWFIMLFLVAAHALTTSLLYVHLSNVSGIETLAEFAYSIFGAATTGTAIAFMTRVFDNFGADDRQEKLLAQIEQHLRPDNGVNEKIK
jgi:hypothetical protein